MNTPSLRAQWDSLQLELLTPASLTEEKLTALTHWRTDPQHPSIALTLPFTIASFKPDIRQEIETLTFTIQDETVGSHLPPEKWAPWWVKLLEKDFQELLAALFQNSYQPANLVHEMGFFTRARVNRLHTDMSDDLLTGPPFCVARLASLPVEILPGNHFASANDEEMALIRRGTFYGSDGIEARQELLRRQILTHLPLGEIALLQMRIDPLEDHENIEEEPKIIRSTLHSSSPIPRGGAHSAFFRIASRKAAL